MGAPGYLLPPGAVYVFNRTATGRQQQAELEGSDHSPRFRPSPADVRLFGRHLGRQRDNRRTPSDSVAHSGRVRVHQGLTGLAPGGCAGGPRRLRDRACRAGGCLGQHGLGRWPEFRLCLQQDRDGLGPNCRVTAFARPRQWRFRLRRRPVGQDGHRRDRERPVWRPGVCFRWMSL